MSPVPPSGEPPSEAGASVPPSISCVAPASGQVGVVDELPPPMSIGAGGVGTVMLAENEPVLKAMVPSASRPVPVNGVLPSLASHGRRASAMVTVESVGSAGAPVMAMLGR